MPNELYKRRGRERRLGGRRRPNRGSASSVRGTAMFHHLFGTLASPETYGNYGAGSTLFWVDPERDVSFALCSAGVMTQAANIERCQKLVRSRVERDGMIVPAPSFPAHPELV